MNPSVEQGALAGLLASLTVMAGIVLGSIITVPPSKFPYSPRNTHGCPNITEFMKFISNNTSTATPTPVDAERYRTRVGVSIISCLKVLVIDSRSSVWRTAAVHFLSVGPAHA